MLKYFFCFSLVFIAQGFSSVQANDDASPFPSRLEADLSAGTSAIYLLDFKSAEEHFDRAILIDPGHPAAYFFRLMLTWYRLTYDSLMNRNPALEKVLDGQAELTVEKAKAFSKNPRTLAVGCLYRGGALGAKGWYHVTRNQWVRAYLSGKKGYAYVKKVVEIDPEVYDAYLGIGVYEYYAATLGPTLRALASFYIRGDRESALRHLRMAEVKSRYVRLESSYFQWNAALEEGRLDDALEKAESLNRSFPMSPFFMWCEIQTHYARKRWEDVIRKSQEYLYLAESGPQPEGYRNPFELLSSKVLYHCGMSAYSLRDFRLAKLYFDRAIDQQAEFLGWKILAYLRRGELFDLEHKRLDALGKYRVVLKYPDVWDSHRIAHKRIKEPYRGE
jgi:tetratricopeptide (TPR) repeat protein